MHAALICLLSSSLQGNFIAVLTGLHARIHVSICSLSSGIHAFAVPFQHHGHSTGFASCYVDAADAEHMHWHAGMGIVNHLDSTA